jgi:hypothetical protein
VNGEVARTRVTEDCDKRLPVAMVFSVLWCAPVLNPTRMLNSWHWWPVRPKLRRKWGVCASPNRAEDSFWSV